MQKFLSLALMTALVLTGCSSDDNNNTDDGGGEGDNPVTATYRVTFTPNWTEDQFPTDYPANAGFSAMVVAVHAPGKNVFRLGQQASAGLKVYAETGGLHRWTTSKTLGPTPSGSAPSPPTPTEPGATGRTSIRTSRVNSVATMATGPSLRPEPTAGLGRWRSSMRWSRPFTKGTRTSWSITWPTTCMKNIPFTRNTPTGSPTCTCPMAR